MVTKTQKWVANFDYTAKQRGAVLVVGQAGGSRKKPNPVLSSGLSGRRHACIRSDD